MKKPDKRKFMEEMFGLGIYSKLQKIANGKLKDIESNLNTKRISLDHNLKTMDDTKTSILKLKTKVGQMKSSQEDVDRVINKKDEIVSKLIGIEEYENLKTLYTNEKDLYESKKTELMILYGKIEENNRNLKELNNTLSGMKIKKVPDIKTIELKKKEIKDTIESLENEDRRLLLSINKVSYDTKYLINRKNAISGKDICPTCGQDIDDGICEDTDSKIDILELELKGYINALPGNRFALN
jgi:DNA repair exonuclease SbcCD ATPase subunit